MTSKTCRQIDERVLTDIEYPLHMGSGIKVLIQNSKKFTKYDTPEK